MEHNHFEMGMTRYITALFCLISMTLFGASPSFQQMTNYVVGVAGQVTNYASAVVGVQATNYASAVVGVQATNYANIVTNNLVTTNDARKVVLTNLVVEDVSNNLNNIVFMDKTNRALRVASGVYLGGVKEDNNQTLYASELATSTRCAAQYYSAYSSSADVRFRIKSTATTNLFSFQSADATTNVMRILPTTGDVDIWRNLTVPTLYSSSGNFSNVVSVTNGLAYQGYLTNGDVTVAENWQIYCLNGTNQLVTLPNAATYPWRIFRFVSTNGNGNLIITNATGAQTIRDGASLSLKSIGVGEVGLFSDGANWQLASKFRTVWPNASWSCTNSIVLPTAVATNMYFDTAEFNNSQGLALVNGYQFYITNFGQYFFTFSTVLTKTAPGSANIYASIWPRQSGVDVPRSRTRISCYNQNDIRVMTVNYIFTVVTNNTYFDLMALCNAGGISLYAEGGYTNAPVMPSTIVTINRISDPRP